VLIDLDLARNRISRCISLNPLSHRAIMIRSQILLIPASCARFILSLTDASSPNTSPSPTMPRTVSAYPGLSPRSLPHLGIPISERSRARQINRILSPEEQDKMRTACRVSYLCYAPSHLTVSKLAREVLDLAASQIKPGITTDEIDAIVHQATIDRGAYPSPLNYRGFPKSVCT
jgi:hypothetical protein